MVLKSRYLNSDCRCENSCCAIFTAAVAINTAIYDLANFMVAIKTATALQTQKHLFAAVSVSPSSFTSTQ